MDLPIGTGWSRDNFDKLPPAMFDGSSDFHSRDYWVNKLVEMGKAH